MFFKSIRFTRFMTAAVVLSVLAVTVLTVHSLKSVADSAKTADVIGDGCSVEEYLMSFGLKSEDVTVDEITVPQRFNDVYENYNAIQRSQGFDLGDYRGKALTRYTCRLTEYNGEDGYFAEVLTYCGEVVGADVYSAFVGGGMYCLK